MLKLKKLIQDLSQVEYMKLEENLMKSKAEHFYLLLNAYRLNSKIDHEIIGELNVTSNSFYVLKSRLYDKIQTLLTGDVHSKKDEVIKLLQKMPVLVYSNSREVSIALLLKLEKDLLYYDMHNELLQVYSFLKKMHLHSQKYFHYSQHYNKHIAYSLSLEKSWEILGNFNRLLGHYHFGRSTKILDTLLFIHKEINDHYALNKSRQIEIIKNVIEVQLVLFCETPLKKEVNIEERLNQTLELLNTLPPSSPSKVLSTPLDFLYFEYNYRFGQIKTAQVYFDRLEENIETLFLQNNLCLTPLFILSRISFLQKYGDIKHLANGNKLNLLFDPDDLHTMVLLGIYKAMRLFYNGKYKEMAHSLNAIINANSFKDMWHIQVEIKLSLAYAYYLMKEYDLLDNVLKSLSRKIKSEYSNQYRNVLDLIKVFELETKKTDHKVTEKQRDHFALFLARNHTENQVLDHLLFELRKRYN